MRFIIVFSLVLFIATPVLAQNSPKKPESNSKKPTQPLVKTDCDCKDFKNQQEAQRVLDAFPGEPHKLDQDKDGIACENLP